MPTPSKKSTPLESLVACGTKLWLDSVDPDQITEYLPVGTTGATSNPIIIADLIRTGRFDDELGALLEHGLDDESIAWELTDRLVQRAQDVFSEAFDETHGDNGYVSFELDPLLEDPASPLSIADRSKKYIELGKKWAAGQSNRMIKVPATPAGLGALESLAAARIALNVTLVFTDRQYRAARDAIWRGAQTLHSKDRFKSVYSIFISRIDVYTKKHVPQLSPAAQGLVGIVNSKRIWQENMEFWGDKNLPLKQEIVFASTGTKDPGDSPDKYVRALAGSDIQTNPPATMAAVQGLKDATFTDIVGQLPSAEVLEEIDREVDFEQLERVLMEEGLKKFADPQKQLLKLIAEKRTALMSTGS